MSLPSSSNLRKRGSSSPPTQKENAIRGECQSKPVSRRRRGSDSKDVHVIRVPKYRRIHRHINEMYGSCPSRRNFLKFVLLFRDERRRFMEFNFDVFWMVIILSLAI
jgi:hypothetical protein